MEFIILPLLGTSFNPPDREKHEKYQNDIQDERQKAELGIYKETTKKPKDQGKPNVVARVLRKYVECSQQNYTSVNSKICSHHSAAAATATCEESCNMKNPSTLQLRKHVAHCFLA